MTSQKTVTKAAGLMMVAILASRLLGLIRDKLVAYQFGQGALVSAYTVAFNLPDLLYFFLSSGALSGAFIPVFTQHFQTGKKKEAWQIFSIIACFMGLVMLSAIAISEVFTTPMVKVFAAPGYADDPELLGLVVFLTRIILPCQFFFFLGGLMMGTLESRQNFKARAAGPVIYNLGIIFGAVFLSKWLSISALAWGALIGSFAGNVGYTYYWMRREGFEFHPSLNLRHPGVKKVGALALPVILGLSLPQIDVIINRYFATMLGDVAPAALNYANRLMQVPLGVFAQAAGTAILPTLSAYAAKNAIDDLRSSLSFGLRAIMAINVPATLFTVVMAEPIVRTIYLGGEFTSADVGPAAIALVWYGAGIFAWAGQAIVARGFFAMQDTITPVILGSIVTVIFIPLNIILMRVMGHAGLALATSIAATIHLIGLVLLIRGRTNGIEGGRVVKSLAKVLVASAVMAFVAVGVRFGMASVVGSWQLQEGDLRRPVAMSRQLESATDPVSKYLYSQLSPETKKASVTRWQADATEEKLRTMLASDINRIVSGPSIYNAKAFEDVKLPAELADDVEDSSQTNTSRINRLLLRAAYPGAIPAVETKPNWLITLATGKRSRPANGSHSGDKWLVAPEDISKPVALSRVLLSRGNPVSKLLRKDLSPSTIDEMQKFMAERKASASLSDLIARDINKVIRTGSLSQKKTDSGYSGSKLAALNRRALEAAYPDYIVTRPVHRVEGQLASALTVLIAMTASGLVYLGMLKLLKVEEADFVWDMVRRRFGRRRSGVTPSTD